MLPTEAPGARRAARLRPRALTVRALLVLAASGALLLAAAAGCGGDDGEPGDATETPPPVDGTELSVALHPEGRDGRPSRTAEVRCPDDRADQGVCEAVDALPENAAAPVPPGAICTQIYGGPDVVRIEGTLRGEEVDTELTRANGCEIERFDRFRPLLRALFEGYRPGRAAS